MRAGGKLGAIVSNSSAETAVSPKTVASGSAPSIRAPHFAQKRAASFADAPQDVQNMKPGFYHLGPEIFGRLYWPVHGEMPH
jgi:hypothetical protein